MYLKSQARNGAETTNNQKGENAHSLLTHHRVHVLQGFAHNLLSLPLKEIILGVHQCCE